MNVVEVRQARVEYDAWQLLVAECKRNGIDLNTDTRFHAALTAWGEELVALRMLQDERVVDRAHSEATDRFDLAFADAFTPPNPFGHSVKA